MNDKVSLSVFEWRVLAVTLRIPLGETRSYQWIAKEAGAPRAVRAVGQALKKNPFPLLIPCHRVIRSDGKIGGYSAGGERVKRDLLALEREIKNVLSLTLRKKPRASTIGRD